MYAYTFKTKQACPNLTGPACWHQPAELQTCMPQEKPRPPAHPSTPSFTHRQLLAQRAYFTRSSAPRRVGKKLTAKSAQQHVATHDEHTYFNQQGRLLGAATQTNGMASTKNLNRT